MARPERVHGVGQTRLLACTGHWRPRPLSDARILDPRLEWPMTLDDYQREAERTVNPALDESGRLLDACAGLAEEAGEVLGQVRKHQFQGRTLDRDRLAAELGDALWCLTIAASTVGLSLEAVARGNVEKLRQRHPNGFVQHQPGR